MRNKLFVGVILLIVFSFFSQQTFAWGVTGHRVVAEIAERHLSKKAKKNIKKLMGKEPLAFWANWADFIKSDTSWRHASKWHYVNIPGNLSKEDFLESLSNVKVENLYSQIKALQAQLKDKNITVADKNTALRFLIHMVGDLGQPLHVGREEDQGGNRINVSWFGTSSNLHQVWDEKLVDFQQWSYTEYATVLNVESKNQITQWQNMPLEDWFYESYVVANKIYDNAAGNTKLRYEYNYFFVHDMNTQLLKTGVRLAKMLNDIFG